MNLERICNAHCISFLIWYLVRINYTPSLSISLSFSPLFLHLPPSLPACSTRFSLHCRNFCRSKPTWEYIFYLQTKFAFAPFGYATLFCVGFFDILPALLRVSLKCSRQYVYLFFMISHTASQGKHLHTHAHTHTRCILAPF